MAPARAVLRLGQVADGADDVQSADAPRRDGDDQGRQQHAEGVRDDDAARADVVLDGQAHRPERAAQHEHHPEGDRNADGGPHGCCRDVIGNALVDEHLHEMAAASPDRARYPELAAPLGREHDEDEEDQQHTGRDRETSEGREHRHERGALSVRLVERVALDGIDLEPEQAHVSAHCARHVIRELHAVHRIAVVGDEHVLDEVRLVEERLCGAQADQHTRTVGARAVEVHDGAHARGLPAVSGEQLQRVSGFRIQVVRSLGGDVDLTRGQVGE